MKPLSSVSLDLDNKWSYLRTRGDSRWAEFPSYLGVAVPRILDFLARHELRITFFVVGTDAAADTNRGPFDALAHSGHEFASHSFTHQPWLHLFTEQELNDELARAEDAIEAATGAKVDGFRGPGYSLSRLTLEVLEQRGYRYDASACPNVLGPLARAYLLAGSNLDASQRQRRRGLYGSLADALKPVKPYLWDLGGPILIELPVTTVPLFRVPMHFSYVLYLAQFSSKLAQAYFRTALRLCRLTDTEPSLLLHPLDFLGAGDDRDLAFFPAMSMAAEAKLEIVSACIDALRAQFEPVSVGRHVDELEKLGTLRRLKPDFKLGG